MRCIYLFALVSVEFISQYEFETTIKAKTFLSFLQSIIFLPNVPFATPQTYKTADTISL